MKKIIVFLMGVFVSIFSATAQDITEFFKTQKANDDVKYTRISPDALNLTSKAISFLSIFSDDISKSDKETIKLLSDLTDIEFLVAKDSDTNLLKALKKEKFFESANYKPINVVSHDKDDVYVYAKNSQDSLIHNLLVVLTDGDNNATVVANVKGDIHPEQIEKIISLTRKSTKNGGPHIEIVGDSDED